MTVSSSPRAARPGRLAARQLDVLREIANGATNEEAATTLHLSARTVEQHLYRAARNLGTAGTGRAHTVAVAMALGLIRADEIRIPETGPRP